MSRSLFTSESVSMGHPDKVADQISDAILDAMLEQDPRSRVACETMVTTGLVVVAGEVTTKAYVDIPKVVRNTIKEIGYTDPTIGFEYESCAVMVTLDEQSPDIAQGVNQGEGLHKEQGAGDQGLMFGYACNETPELMPLPISLSHRILAEHAKLRQKGKLKYLQPDAKSQVTIEYEGDKPLRVHTVVVSTQHTKDVKLTTIRKDMIAMIKRVVPKRLIDSKTIFHINPTGRFEIGGPKGDCGLTGRKIIVDTYGGMGRHGGGAFSGKDPSKVDRSAAYAARWVAKNLVAAKLATRCEIQLAYAIGVAEPVSIKVDSFGTGVANDDVLSEAVAQVFDLTPRGIITGLKLLRPIYRHTAYHGHFGRKEFPWEGTTKVAALKKAVKQLEG
ncbi:MAG: methionine adenosyltransferase [Planctomycetota bacterium]|jgi:S-adenosylmethionine synthetase|nr:methionine adenosyltransferase [Planctomycetota bacterium]